MISLSEKLLGNRQLQQRGRRQALFPKKARPCILVSDGERCLAGRSQPLRVRPWTAWDLSAPTCPWRATGVSGVR